ncbi:tetrahydrofolate dehydrogenase/cyclohydrolase, NAD(P)-binding domain protein [Limosilactobacillus coleohominis 101-4-CHN]|uniref:Bifunctional protein FolD n=1 Tax=Limosilactobacillus coleohominis 101-4-CHN TaxID=575594 RepID=C7XUR2_9LACO|nr:bifunctional methylenetetrahydrofolate dehydrogenase/methenyltetrahydrofolate cyclohydrolase [Limosilactobacillus coleohominis]EEU31023.1 tetrahydrofolate dehydrogenase/cyclohydrolase, NAD(P)-binding domain protein [Limosilactobacillus coleohominis 101-4-CHN]
MAKVIDGKQIASNLNQQTAMRTQTLINRGITPGLAVVLVGDDPASVIYTRNKSRQANRLGFYSVLKKYPAEVSEATLLGEIQKLNDDPQIHGILVQSPLPAHIPESRVIEAIAPQKDVDGFNPVNVGKLYTNDQTNYPVACTPRGIMTMLETMDIDVTGAEVAIIGRSHLVGKPLQSLMMNHDATVTILHHASQDANYYLKHADIVVVAVGKPQFLKANQVKPGAVVIDVGINRKPNGHLVGDVDYDDVSSVASAITPVPGGVGPMTIATLMQQTVDLAEWSTNND